MPGEIFTQRAFVLVAKAVGATIALGSAVIVVLVAQSVVRPTATTFLSTEPLGIRLACLAFSAAACVMGVMILRARK